MTEDDARSWAEARYDKSALSLLTRYHDMLIAANDQQNLIAPSTTSTIWSRHFVDSAQLLDHVPTHWNHWVDIGSGAGLPGLVIAILTGRRITLIEPRRLRAEFLAHCSDALGLSCVRVIQARAEIADIAEHADIISARAVAKLDTLLASSRLFANSLTTYILPKGKSAKSEVADARRSWQGMFHVEQSIVDPTSGIVVATGVTPR